MSKLSPVPDEYQPEDSADEAQLQPSPNGEGPAGEVHAFWPEEGPVDEPSHPKRVRRMKPQADEAQADEALAPAADEAQSSYDPFDPEALRVNAEAGIEVERVLTSVPVKKPKRDVFVRVHPTYVLDTLLLERDTGMEKESYLVAPQVQHLVLPELRRTRLFVAMSKRGTLFLWPIKLPIEGNDSGRRIADTALLCAEQAKTTWVRVVWDKDLGGYEMFRAKGDLGEPQWPDKSFRDLLEIAFRHNRIDRADHPVIRELEGQL